MSFFDYLSSRSERVVELTVEHAEVVALSIALAAIVGVAAGVAVYRHERASVVALGVASIFLTIPSFALFGLLIAPLGLRAVDPAVLESARGMGMGRRRRLTRIELPLAWPVILAGIRVSTLITLGIAAIAAAINGPGLGDLIFSGISRIGAVNALNETVTGILGVIVLALVFDVLFFVLRQLTVARGVRG
jgi:osmoprotectant transport system permease protein